MARITVSPNVPIPESKRVMPGEARYPFLDMKVGDSFFVPLTKGKTVSQLRNAINSSAYYVPGKPGMSGAKFSTRKVEENGQVGIRCWRVK